VEGFRLPPSVDYHIFNDYITGKLYQFILTDAIKCFISRLVYYKINANSFFIVKVTNL
jgi:hypothetical protein